jgi:hypothetical protein
MTQGYEEQLHTALTYFDSFKNLRTIGRSGAYNYIGTLDAIDTGFGMARVLCDAPADRNRWLEERKRTGFYPILD